MTESDRLSLVALARGVGVELHVAWAIVDGLPEIGLREASYVVNDYARRVAWGEELDAIEADRASRPPSASR